VGRGGNGGAGGVIPVVADFTKPFDLTGLGDAGLDGMLFANALHFVRDPAPVLARLAAWLRPGGRAVVVEYDRRRANPWVPYPIWAERVSELVVYAGISVPVISVRRPYAF